MITVTFGPHPTHPQLSSCEGLVKFIDDNVILNDKYVKIFVNPFENHLPELFLNEIREKKIPLPQLKPGSKSFKKFDEIYGTPDCHHSRDRPKTKREIADGLNLNINYLIKIEV